MTALAVIAAGLSGISFAVSVWCAFSGTTESLRHHERQSIGWAAVAALFFIASRLP